MKPFYYIKNYPFSLAVICLVIYLSFFKPPSVPDLERIPYFDKVVHIGMYFTMSGALWLEFLRSHKNGSPVWHAWIGAFLFPIVFSGTVEILQSMTDYRGGDWLDFLANSIGATLASLLAYYVLRPRILRRK